MKITFDSNTWRNVVTPDRFPNEPTRSDYLIIRNAILSKAITPYMSETAFTLETIPKRERKSYFKKLAKNFRRNKETEHPGNNSIINEHFENAIGLGFRIVRFPRLGAIINHDIEAYRYKLKETAFFNFMAKASEVYKVIGDFGGGDSEIKNLVYKHTGIYNIIGIADLPDELDGQVAKAVAEWADGDSVVCHVGIGGDYFCTNDNAISGGINSIFSKKNLEILEQKFDFKAVNPSELASLIKLNT